MCLSFYYLNYNHSNLYSTFFCFRFDLSDSFFLGINAAYFSGDEEDGIGNFAGVALYPQLATSDNFTIGLRGEYFALHSDAPNAVEPSVFATTLTGSYTVENLIIKPEIRLDALTNQDDGQFYGNFVDSDGVGTDSLAAFTLAAIYTF